eukprot:GFUD01044440.1.p1 GENE.GFUD01044440.1~~GFUD01044440.1.p1  ORF type:complete len:113 (-),score=22.74 GFUD01044440.1:162-500(-)
MNGCSQSLLLSSRPAHETCCSYRLVSCPNILCNLKIILAGLYCHIIVVIASMILSLSTVLMTGRVKNVEEYLYKVQFFASILGSPEQGRPFMVSIAVFSERMVRQLTSHGLH